MQKAGVKNCFPPKRAFFNSSRKLFLTPAFKHLFPLVASFGYFPLLLTESNVKATPKAIGNPTLTAAASHRPTRYPNRAAFVLRKIHRFPQRYKAQRHNTVALYMYVPCGLIAGQLSVKNCSCLCNITCSYC